MLNWIKFVFIAMFWGGSFIAIEPLVQVLPPVWAGAIRIVVGMVFMLIALPVLKVPLTLKNEIKWKSRVIGLFSFAVPFSLLFWGETKVSPGIAGVLNGTVSLWVFIIGALFTPGIEKITIEKVLGLMAGLVGVTAIFYPQIVSPDKASNLTGLLAVLGMAVSYALGVLMNRNLLKLDSSFHPFTNLFQQLLFAMVPIAVLAFVVEGVPSFDLTAEQLKVAVLSEIYLGVVSTGIAFMLFYQLIKAWGSVRSATVTYCIPVAALIIDFVINRRIPLVNEWLGVLLVSVALVMMSGRLVLFKSPKVSAADKA